MIPLEMTQPTWLWVLVPIALLIGGYFVRSLSDFPLRQRQVSLAIRLVLLTCIVLSLCGLAWISKTNEQCVVLLIDESQSVGDEGKSQVETFLKELQPHRDRHQAFVLPFASEPQLPVELSEWLAKAKSLSQKGSDPLEASRFSNPISRLAGEGQTPFGIGSKGLDEPSDSKQIQAYRDGTDLAAAIEAAAGYMPSGYVPRIVLLTDGNATRGDAVATAARSRISVDTIALPTTSTPEVQVAAVHVPAEVREGEPFYVEVIVQSNHADEGLIEVFRNDHKVISERKAIESGANVFRFQQSIERDRLAAYTVRVSGLQQDTLLDNNSEVGLVYAAGKPRVLIVESDPNLIRELAYALEDEGIQVDTRPPQGMPESLADLQNYECLILSNVPATALTQQQMEIARTWVQDLGGGFIMLGGEQSFGLGGYYKSALEEILPVRSDFEKEKEKPSLGMVLVIDKSGSMDGDPIEMAKAAAQSAVELLGKRDQVAVLAFDGDTYVVSEMQSAANKGKVADEISRIDSGGGTTMYPAMEMAHQILSATSARLKHVIILTDGVSSPGDFEGLAQQMANEKMTVSTVALGQADVELLEQIARVGKGRHYATDDPSQIPQIFAKETVTASKSAIDEQPFVPIVIRATHALAELDLENSPFLLGYVMTRPKPTAEVILATEKGDPLLAWWRYGLGMTAAFTSDAKSRWAAEWMTWPGYGKFWTQVVRQVMRKSDTRGIQVQAEANGSLVAIDVDAVDEVGQFINQANVELTLIDPKLKRRAVSLSQEMPGRYSHELALNDQGAYHLEVVVKKNEQVIYRQTRGLMRGYSDELRIRPSNESLLQEIAAVSRGRYGVSAVDLFAATHEQAQRPIPLWPYLLTAAAILLIADVTLRRIDFSSFVSG